MKVVFIGADPRTAEIATLSVRLRWPDVAPLVVSTATEGLEALRHESPDVVILHPDFDDMSLLQTLRELRALSSVPLLILGYHGDEMEVVTALELGADDYVRLPCDLTEMMARIWALLRRVGARNYNHDKESPILCGRLRINPATYEVLLDDERVLLTSTEFRLLHLLVKNRGTVVSHHMLEQELWGGQTNSSGLAKKYVQRLRRKLGDDAREPCWVASVHGVGYRFIGPEPDSSEPMESVAASAR